VWRFENVQNELHRRDPAGNPRTAVTAYALGRRDLERVDAACAGDPAIGTLAAIYHSHTKVGAYFSGEDRARAMFVDEPLYPEIAWVVRLRQPRAGRGARVSLDEARRDFVEVPGGRALMASGPLDLGATLAGVRLPFCAMNASGARCGTAAELRGLAGSDAGAVVLKTATVHPFVHRQYRSLQNPGYDRLLPLVAELAARERVVIPSIAGATLDELVTLARAFADGGATLVEVNLADPWVAATLAPFESRDGFRRLLGTLAGASSRPLALKLPERPGLSYGVPRRGARGSRPPRRRREERLRRLREAARRGGPYLRRRRRRRHPFRLRRHPRARQGRRRGPGRHRPRRRRPGDLRTSRARDARGTRRAPGVGSRRRRRWRGALPVSRGRLRARVPRWRFHGWRSGRCAAARGPSARAPRRVPQSGWRRGSGSNRSRACSVRVGRSGSASS
jgi:proteasome lid subunit RPN8/RPN11